MIDETYEGYTIPLPLWVLDLDTWTWYLPDKYAPDSWQLKAENNQTIQISGQEHLIRADGAISTVVDDKMLVYIGWQCYDKPSLTCESADNRVSQMIIIDPLTDQSHWTVTRIPLKGDYPLVAYPAYSVLTDDFGHQILYSWGGQWMDSFNNVRLGNDLYLLNLTTLVWSKSATENKMLLKPRLSPAAVTSNNTFYVFGGADSRNTFRELWKLTAGMLKFVFCNESALAICSYSV